MQRRPMNVPMAVKGIFLDMLKSSFEMMERRVKLTKVSLQMSQTPMIVGNLMHVFSKTRQTLCICYQVPVLRRVTVM